MKKIVFYSWQSDLPNSTNRSLIEDTLKQAALDIAKDDGVDIEPVIDRDTQGVAGAVDIASTIFAKITAADLFVADITTISKPKGKRATPNPNVLIELGYALKAIGHEQMVLVFNKAFGKVEEIPFDLRTRKLLTYNCPDGTTDYTAIKKELVRDFKSALTAGLAQSPKKEAPLDILNAIENKFPNKIVLLRKYLATLLLELEKIQPKMHRDGGTAEELINAISKSQPLLVDFAKLSETNVLMNDLEATEEIFKWFGGVYEKYNPASNPSGKISTADGDFFKFIGHELFVMFMSPFLKEERWKDIKKILGWTFKADDKQYRRGVQRISWSMLSDTPRLLIDESRRKGRVSLHSDILRDRHTDGGLASVVPFREFSETDFFLYLYGERNGEDESRSPWYPTTIIWLDHVPVFITDAQDYPTAVKIADSLYIGGVDALKERIHSVNKGRIRFEGFPPINDADIKKIGTVGGAKIISE